MTALTYSDVVLGAIRREYSGQRHAAKRLARDANVSHRTAENWVSGLCPPNGESLVELMAVNDALKDAIIELISIRKAEREE